MVSGELLQRTRIAFRGQFGVPWPRFFAAPGRVNLIGEHTDYNDGFVLPVAIDRHVVVAARRRSDKRVRIHADQFGQSCTFSLDRIEPAADAPWSNYARGVAHVLQSKGHQLCGLDCVIVGNVPMGAGLSSSAAIEVAMAVAWRCLSGLTITDVELALACQQAEAEFVGVQCGIMDQFISALGHAGHALLIDCRSLGNEHVAIPGGVSVVVCDTRRRRGLVDSQYNARRKECQRGVELLRQRRPAIRALRDVTPEQLLASADILPEITVRRCRHVVTENQRVLATVSALRAGYTDQIGTLMTLSHLSLRDDYEVSCAELDAMVEAAWETPGTIGARMTGAGFGGCAVALVRTDATTDWVPAVLGNYRERTGTQGDAYVCAATDGAGEIAPE